MNTPIRYVIVSPVRDEAEHLEETIAAVTAQTILPARWVLVNDGSHDNTGAIAEEAERSHPWIRVVHRSDRGFRKAGSGVVEAFYDGLKAVELYDWDFLVKLDGDLSFSPDYFESCFARFTADPTLGIGGGLVQHGIKGVPEDRNPDFHVRGATKIYRRDCWTAIGGIASATGWDTLDEVKANMLGWKTRTFKDLVMHHHRYTGAADGKWKNLVKNGRANYIAGYHPLFMAVKCLRRLLERPYGVGALGLLVGFISGYVKHIPRISDERLIEYLRGQQLNRMLGRATIWK
jgi:poly-beta-1,6-N-acetyl-D-glucosamine synthase